MLSDAVTVVVSNDNIDRNVGIGNPHARDPENKARLLDQGGAERL
jgi:hypothetical protein